MKQYKNMLQIFLSSTFRDLEQERRAVIEIIRRMDEVCIAMEYFGSSPNDALNTDQEKVDQADVFLLILAYQYGNQPIGNAKSYTQIEYERARSQGIPVLAYFVDQDYRTKFEAEKLLGLEWYEIVRTKNWERRASYERKLESLQREIRTEMEELADERLERFKSEVQQFQVVSWYTNEADLAMKVSADLYKLSKNIQPYDLQNEEEPTLAQKHARVVDALLNGRLHEALDRSNALLKEHSGRSPRARYNRACTYSLLAELEPDPKARQKLLDDARKDFEIAMERGIVKLIRLYHEDPTNPEERIRRNPALKCLFEAHPDVVQRYLTAHLSEWGPHYAAFPRLGGGCVAAGMRVSVPDNDSKGIQELRFGETVVSWDCKTRSTSLGVVEKIQTHVIRQVLQINERFTVSASHPILTRLGWTRAAKLSIGCEIQQADGGFERVVSLEWSEGPWLVVDLTVLPHRTFVAEGLVVHNK